MLFPGDDYVLVGSEEGDDDKAPVHADQSPSFEGGLLIVWGCGEFGQHGHGHLSDVPCADAVGSPLWFGQDRLLTSVACGSSHTLAITDDNTLYSWGNSNSGQLGIGTCDTNAQPQRVLLGVASNTKLRSITCGTRHSFVWTEDGDAFSFGNNYSAQLGYDFRRPDFKENQLRPIFVDTLLHRQVHQVACGARHSVFLFRDGKVASVGANNRGQLGNGDTVDSECPVNVPDLTGICYVACGNSHSLATDGQGNVYAWGYGKACGSRTDLLSPVCIWTAPKAFVQSLAGGDSHSMLLQNDGRVFTWGNNFEGQLGQGKDVKFRERPAEVEFDIQLDEKIVYISGGENTSAAVTENGQLFLWGKNASNVIREDKGPRAFQYEPHPVNLGHWKVHKVSCGSWHIACIVTHSEKLQSFRPGVANGVQSEEERLLSESVLVQMHHKNDDVETVWKRETENNTHKNGEDSRVACEQWWASDNIRNDDDSTLLGQADLGQTTEPEGGASAAINGYDEVEWRSDSEAATSLPSWLASEQVRTEAKDNRDSQPALALERPCEDTPSQYSGVEMTTVSKTSEDLSKEDLLSSKRPLPCVAPTDGSESDEFEVCFETTLFGAAKQVCYKSGLPKSENSRTSGSADSPEEPEKTQKSVALEEPATDTSEAGFEHLEARNATKAGEQVLRKESPAKSPRARVMSDGPTRVTNESPLTETYSQLKSNSLTNLTLGFVYDVRVDPSQQQKVSSSPPSSRYFTKGKTGTGQLHREKKAPRTLRRVSWDAEPEYYLPNQPMHTADVTGTEWQRRRGPQSPMHRAQSSPSLYSSNLTRSPPASAQVSLKAPRPTVPAPGISGLPPRPPAGRKPGVRRPLFSSGTSWRTRK